MISNFLNNLIKNNPILIKYSVPSVMERHTEKLISNSKSPDNKNHYQSLETVRDSTLGNLSPRESKTSTNTSDSVSSSNIKNEAARDKNRIAESLENTKSYMNQQEGNNSTLGNNFNSDINITNPPSANTIVSDRGGNDTATTVYSSISKAKEYISGVNNRISDPEVAPTLKNIANVGGNLGDTVMDILKVPIKLLYSFTYHSTEHFIGAVNYTRLSAYYSINTERIGRSAYHIITSSPGVTINAVKKACYTTSSVIENSIITIGNSSESIYIRATKMRGILFPINTPVFKNSVLYHESKSISKNNSSEINDQTISNLDNISNTDSIPVTNDSRRPESNTLDPIATSTENGKDTIYINTEGTDSINDSIPFENSDNSSYNKNITNDYSAPLENDENSSNDMNHTNNNSIPSENNDNFNNDINIPNNTDNRPQDISNRDKLINLESETNKEVRQRTINDNNTVSNLNNRDINTISNINNNDMSTVSNPNSEDMSTGSNVNSNDIGTVSNLNSNDIVENVSNSVQKSVNDIIIENHGMISSSIKEMSNLLVDYPYLTQVRTGTFMGAIGGRFLNSVLNSKKISLISKFSNYLGMRTKIAGRVASRFIRSLFKFIMFCLSILFGLLLKIILLLLKLLAKLLYLLIRIVVAIISTLLKIVNKIRSIRIVNKILKSLILFLKLFFKICNSVLIAVSKYIIKISSKVSGYMTFVSMDKPKMFMNKIRNVTSDIVNFIVRTLLVITRQILFSFAIGFDKISEFITSISKMLKNIALYINKHIKLSN